MKFAIEIGATDRTEGGLRSVVSRFRSFARTALRPITVPITIARGGLRLLRDINLGLRPPVAGIDQLIERGAALETIRKSFANLTGTAGRGVERMARQLVNAASGTLRLGEAMAIANRALAGGLSFDQLGVAIDFISKKSVTTGKNASDALGTVITGLSRGSTLFLDDFGILVDGIEGVREAFDKLKGRGSFDALSQSAQKAETVNQAIAEMRGQLGKLGVSGNETVFLWQRIKNSIGDAVDGLTGAVAGSQEMHQALRGIRETIDAMRAHIEGGGAIKELLFGKGDSGGLAGLAGALLKDVGLSLGRGIFSAMAGGLASLLRAIDPFVARLKGELFGAFDELKVKVREIGEEFGAAIRKSLAGINPRALLGLEGGPAATAQPTTTTPAAGRGMTIGQAIGASASKWWNVGKKLFNEFFLIDDWYRMRNFGLDPDTPKARPGPGLPEVPIARASGRHPLHRGLQLGQMALGGAMAATGGGVFADLAAKVERIASSVLGEGQFGDVFFAAWEKFIAQYGGEPAKAPTREPPVIAGRLNQRERMDLRRQQAQAKRDFEVARRRFNLFGERGTDRVAYQRAMKRLAQLRREGRASRGDMDVLLGEERERRHKELAGVGVKAIEELEGIDKRFEADEQSREPSRRIARRHRVGLDGDMLRELRKQQGEKLEETGRRLREDAAKAVKEIQAMRQDMKELTGAADRMARANEAVAHELVGYETRLQAVRQHRQ